MTTGKRFKVALSFPGEKREFIEQVAEYLAKEYGRRHIFYDMYHKVELAQPSMDLILMDNYKVNAELVVAFLCREYDEKEWCGVEWRVIRHIIKEKRYNEIMPFRFDDTEIDGFLSIDGYIFIDENESPESIARYIIERISLNDDARPKVT
ncbi:MAG: TIR domain-containing protein, partial [Taibaiella sp.]|nr:TIR domain-containing protein [Taibaiella sp.]